LNILQLTRDMLLIRRFEERLLQLFGEGLLHGTTHAYIGQEAVAASLFAHLNQDDLVFSNHRCHGHYLLHQRDPLGLLAELMGRQGGTCGGVGGSQHLQRGNFYSNGVQGGIAPALVGMTWAERFFERRQGIGCVFLGDGTLGQGQVYEAMNLASLWNLPVLFVIEHNGWSQSTPSHLQIAGSVRARPEAFGIPTFEIASNDIHELEPVAAQAVAQVRSGRGPVAVVCHTFRLCSHSKSDDGRPPEVIEPWLEKDPLRLAQAHLEPHQWQQLCDSVDGELRQVEELALAQPQATHWNLPGLAWPKVGPRLVIEDRLRVGQALNQGFHRLLAERPEVVVVGMDILDPYGGAFKVEKGLSTRFPGQVLPTPVCEMSLTGACAGMALRGLRPVLQIMFGDFLTLAVEPLVNYASKYRGMYNDQVRCPLVVRAAMGGGRGYGPTHSQSLEKLLLGIPDLRVVALSVAHDPQALLFECVEDDSPVLLVENKLVYSRPLLDLSDQQWGPFSIQSSPGPYPTLVFSGNDFRFSDGVLATYGGNLEMALEVSRQLLEEHELSLEVVAFSLLYPPPLDMLQAALERARGRLITLEEAALGGGWGSEIIARGCEQGWIRKARRLGARESVIPSARSLEEEVLPGPSELRRLALEVMT